jgi:hypothetical protein
MFVLPDTATADLFILYPRGARGDFLAAVLKDLLDHQYKNYSIIPPKFSYQKAHHVQDIIGQPIDRYKTRIRIAVSEVEEYLTVAQLRLDKISAPDSWAGILRQLLNDYNDLVSVDSNFTHVINFKNLYDIEFIKQLYYDINARELTQDMVEKIQFNISLQPWVTLSKNKLEHRTVVQIDQHLLDH